MKYYIPDEGKPGMIQHHTDLCQGMAHCAKFMVKFAAVVIFRVFLGFSSKGCFYENMFLLFRVKTGTCQWYHHWCQLGTNHYDYLVEFILHQRICVAQHSPWGQVQHSTGLHLLRPAVSGALTLQYTTVSASGPLHLLRILGQYLMAILPLSYLTSNQELH